jgi:hypothetical protein
MRHANLHQTWHTYALKPERDFGKVKTPKVSSVRDPRKTVSVAWNLSIIKERRQDQMFLPDRRSQEEGFIPEYLPWVRE